MKRLLTALFAISLLTATVSLPLACVGPTAEKRTYNTIYTLQQTAITAYDAYIGGVIDGKIPTNGVPRVSKAFNVFQATSVLALDAAQWNTNATAPANLSALSLDLLNIIAEVSKK